MMERDASVFLGHILESIAAVDNYTDGMDEAAFLADPLAQDAVLRRLEIIGEAVKNLPDTVRSANPQVPWKRLAGLRDVLIHRYFVVDLQLTWEMVQDQLPELKKQIAALLGEAG